MQKNPPQSEIELKTTATNSETQKLERTLF